MNIVMIDADNLPAELAVDDSWQLFQSIGELKLYSGTDRTNIADRIREADVLLATEYFISGAVMEDAPHLKYIGIMAAGLDRIDLPAASARGITVTNVKGYAAPGVSQFVFSLLLEICNGVGRHAESVRRGGWAANGHWSYTLTQQIELDGKTMGIIGFGAAGRRTADTAEAFGMKVLIYDPYASEETLDHVLAESDVLVLHCPLTEETRSLICRETISRMKDGAILINNARGGLVDSRDLCDALNSRKLYAAGLDVADTEPLENDSLLLHARNCFVTPHISWAAKEAGIRLVRGTYRNLVHYLEEKNADTSA